MRSRMLNRPGKSGAESELLALVSQFKEEVVSAPMIERSLIGGLAVASILSAREIEVLRLVTMGMNNTEIASRLFISLNTVTRHMTNIFAKTGTANRVEAAIYAERHGIS